MTYETYLHQELRQVRKLMIENYNKAAHGTYKTLARIIEIEIKNTPAVTEVVQDFDLDWGFTG